MKVAELETEVNDELLNECGEKAKKILRSKIKSVKQAKKVLAMLEADLEKFKQTEIEDIDTTEHVY